MAKTLDELLEDAYNEAFVAIDRLRNFKGLPLEEVAEKLEELIEHVQDCLDSVDIEIEEDRAADVFDPNDEYDGSIIDGPDREFEDLTPSRDYS